MSLKLYSHPLASFCHKALIALYENGVAFEPVLVNHGGTASLAAFKAVWPMAKMPVLRDQARVLAEAEPHFGLFPLVPKPRRLQSRAIG